MCPLDEREEVSPNIVAEPSPKDKNDEHELEIKTPDNLPFSDDVFDFTP